MKPSGVHELSQEVLARLRGKFIVFDGCDGSGKGAQMRLLVDALISHDIPCVTARDPGGTPIGDRIRHVLLGHDLSEMDVRCEALLFMASRAQLLHEVIGPALAKNVACICDRYVSATCAYQGAAGFDPKRVVELAAFAIGDVWPDHTIIIDLPPKAGFARTGRKPRAERKRSNAVAQGQPTLFHDVETDAMEARPLKFHNRVRRTFLELPAYYPAPVSIVDGSGTIDDVHARVMEALADASF
ncbi:MAG: dTMP kinase [Planctomycetes bacterium]|nr:dTMP kinase [Planctomycetota bacterium]